MGACSPRKSLNLDPLRLLLICNLGQDCRLIPFNNLYEASQLSGHNTQDVVCSCTRFDQSTVCTRFFQSTSAQGFFSLRLHKV